MKLAYSQFQTLRKLFKNLKIYLLHLGVKYVFHCYDTFRFSSIKTSHLQLNQTLLQVGSLLPLYYFTSTMSKEKQIFLVKPHPKPKNCNTELSPLLSTAYLIPTDFQPLKKNHIFRLRFVIMRLFKGVCHIL
jgi:hypothetical protein